MTAKKIRGLSAIHMLGLLALGGIAALLIFGESDNQKRERMEKEMRPQNISELSSKIVGIAEDKKNSATEIILQQSEVWNEESVLFSLASEANKIAKGIQADFKDIKTSTVRFAMQVPLVDKFGNETMTRVIAVNFRTSDLYKINYAQGFELQQLLNLSESVWYVDPISHKLVSAFCNSEPGKYAGEFCRREKNGQGARRRSI